MAGQAFNDLVASGAVTAPIVIGRDHLDAGSVASPERETEGMQDGTDAVADWPILNALLNTASGATWVSVHHGGGVGIGKSIHAGVVVVADGTDGGRRAADPSAHERPRHGRAAPRRRGLRDRRGHGPRGRHPDPDARRDPCPGVAARELKPYGPTSPARAGRASARRASARPSNPIAISSSVRSVSSSELHALRPTDREPPHVGTADEHRVGAEHHRLGDVGTPADAAVDEHRHPTGHRIDHPAQRVGCGRRRVEVAATVVGHDHAGDAVRRRPGQPSSGRSTPLTSTGRPERLDQLG